MLDTYSFYKKAQKDNREAGVYDKDKIKFIVDSIGTNKKVLDVGCNDGYIGAKVIDAGNIVYGIDIVEQNLKKAKGRGLSVINFYIGSGPFPFKNNFFDVVILSDVIEHIFDTDELLEQCRRVLRKGGKIIITTPNVASLARRIMLLIGISPFLEFSPHMSTNGFPSVGHIRYYTVSTLTKQLEKHNFNKVSVEGNVVYVAPFLILYSLRKLLPSLSSLLLCTAHK